MHVENPKIKKKALRRYPRIKNSLSEKNPAKIFSDVSVACDASYAFRAGTFTLKVFGADGEALKSWRYGITMAYLAEVRVQHLTKKFFRHQ